MYKEGCLSVWVGYSESDATLEDYVRVDYSEDGELIPSSLLRDFDLSDSSGEFEEYEEGCREIAFFDNGTLESNLQEFSYSNQFKDHVIEKIGDGINFKINAVIVLFNYSANIDEGEERQSNGTRMKFVLRTEYEL